MKRDWINTYKPSVKKFQQGGPMAPEAAAPAGPEGAPAGGDPGMEIEAMVAEYAQTRDPQLAVAICDMLVELMAGTGAPEGGAPAGPEGGAPPMARNGMKLNRGPVFKK